MLFAKLALIKLRKYGDPPVRPWLPMASIPIYATDGHVGSKLPEKTGDRVRITGPC